MGKVYTDVTFSQLRCELYTKKNLPKKCSRSLAQMLLESQWAFKYG